MNTIKYITRTELNKLINKLALEKQNKDCFNCKVKYDYYKRDITQDNTRTIITLDNQMNTEIEHENKIYFLVKQFFDYNKIITNKNGLERPATRTTIKQIEIIGE